MSTQIHDATMREVQPGEVNVVKHTATTQATGIQEEMWVVWFAAEIRCCEFQQGWPADRGIGVWDSTGVGDWQPAGHVQCGTCGSLIMPTSRLVFDEDEVAQAGAEIATERAKWSESTREAVRATLVSELREAMANGDATGDDVTPGAYVDHGIWVAWDYDPTDHTDIIEISEYDLS